MKTAKVVVGSWFGDEGKGKLTDYFASKYGKDCIVVRFNGGAQAGHTVVTPEGKRHVFSHFGSGSFAGAKTYLSKFFVVNPILFNKEYQTISKLNVTPFVYVDPECLISTPYDMMINQMVEEHRGDKKHGSCGIGFNETIERCRHPEFKTTVKDLFDLRSFLETLKKIVLNWVPNRIAKSGLSKIPDSYMEILGSAEMINHFFEDVEFFKSKVGRADNIFLYTEKNIIFEGAQGLMLDERHHNFPYVTRSKTGLDNVLELIKETDIDNLDITYVTRPYSTRHGAGPLMHETPEMEIEDKTNIHNPWQGSLRFGLLDLDTLKTTIHEDCKKLHKSLSSTFNVAVSCMDQIADKKKIEFVCDNKIKTVGYSEFADTLFSHLPIQYIGLGPERDKMTEV